MDNMKYWNSLKSVPKEMTKEIKAGRLRGFTDIKPQWRIQIMTEVFGPVGVGWYYDNVNYWSHDLNNEVACFCSVNLYVNNNGEWSKPIFGLGGSKLLTQESKGLHVSDEGYKMALTDALSVAMKALGVGADIYLGHGSDSKYQATQNKVNQQEQFVLNKKLAAFIGENQKVLTEEEKKRFKTLIHHDGKHFTKNMDQAEYDQVKSVVDLAISKGFDDDPIY